MWKFYKSNWMYDAYQRIIHLRYWIKCNGEKEIQAMYILFGDEQVDDIKFSNN